MLGWSGEGRVGEFSLPLDFFDSGPQATKLEGSHVYMYMCLCAVGRIICDLVGVSFDIFCSSVQSSDLGLVPRAPKTSGLVMGYFKATKKW